MEESYSEQIKTLKAQNEAAIERAESAERSLQKTNKDVERLEDDLEAERTKCKALEEEMNGIMQDLNTI